MNPERWKMRSEQIEVEEIFRAAQVFALAAATICNWDSQTSGHAKRWSLKLQQKDLTLVLHPPIEATSISGRWEFG